ncbi:MAG TPA: C25 family cysteine peptidase, partial [Anaerolineales bacterium]|nr:C25 family cysteine peptidase [Anaerolineales bacterium]
PHMAAAMFEKYTDQNVYWLDIDGPAGLRMAEISGFPIGNNVIPGIFTARVHAEEDNLWRTLHQSDEDTWFWERFSATSTTLPAVRTYPISLSGVAPGGGPAILSGELHVDTESPGISPDHHIELLINGVSILIAEWDGKGRYAFSAEFSPGLLVDGENQLTLKAYSVPGGSGDTYFFDWFEITYPRLFSAQADQLTFHYSEMGTAFHYQIDGFTSAQIGVLDISNPLEPVVLTTLAGSQQGSAYRVDFQSQHPQTGRYLVTANPLRSPLQVSSYTFKNLHASTLGADYLIIAHSQFLDAAQDLADYRSSQGLRSRVIDLEDILNEFNAGIYHSLAIKSFLAYTLANWAAPAPSYVVLVGSGHWNFFGRPGPTNNYSDAPIYMPPHLVWVDPWQGEVDSASALAAVVGNDVLPDLAIGRIPVDSAEELSAVIQKIISYEAQPGSTDSDRLLFIADNQPDDAGYFRDISEEVISTSIPADQVIDRVNLNDFLNQVDGKTCTPVPFGRDCPEATQAILDAFNHLPVEFVNYTGHATANYWADEELLRTTSEPDRINDPAYNDLALLDNPNYLPVLVSMTCLDGYWIYPSPRTPSLAVNLLRKAGGGVSAAYSPTGLGLANGHDILNKSFFDSIYVHDIRELGAAVEYSKLKLFETGQNFDLIYTYTIFGDPALRLTTPLPSRLYFPLLPARP